MKLPPFKSHIKYTSWVFSALLIVIAKSGIKLLDSLCLFAFWVVLSMSGYCLAESSEEQHLASLQKDSKKYFKDHVAPFLETYCMSCHGLRHMEAGLTFSPASRNPGDAAFIKQWKHALARVKSNDMPPDEAEKQPTAEERQKFIDGIAMIKYLSPQDPGPYVIHRLTKVEYANTLHDLFGVDPSVADALPEDVSGEGYINSLSPLQVEQYLTIANKVLEQVLKTDGKSRNEMFKSLFGEPPVPGDDNGELVRKVAHSLALKVYRRPAADEELDVLLKVFELGQANQLDYDGSLKLMLKAMLVSPQFLFITPAVKADPMQEIVPLDDYQLASRLSYMFWATIPDAELMSLAGSGKLHETEVLKAQVLRLLNDQRSRALFDGFGAQWLGLQNLMDKTFDTDKYPQMTKELRLAMYDEARLFFESIVRENRSAVSFVDSNYTFLNETLATIYGLEKSVTGTEMRRVELSDTNRGGILGMPGILATTSFPNRTSPVKRGVWVLEQVLGDNVPPAPPNVPELDKQDPQKVANMTLRERTELHRTNAVCANCHKLLDPIGFGLENYDAIGRWRLVDDTGGKIDAAGELPGDKHFSSPQELKVIIAARREELSRNLLEKLLAYALCRQLEGYDEVVVDLLLKKLEKEDYRMQSLITEIVSSYPFTHRRVRSHVDTSSEKKK